MAHIPTNTDDNNNDDDAQRLSWSVATKLYVSNIERSNTRSCPQGAKLYNMAPIAKIEYFRVLPRVSTANPNESQPRKRSSTLHSGFSSRSPTHKTASAGEKPRSKATPKQSKARLMDSSLASSATKPTTSKRYGN